jgi:DNA polymerase III epsilon subunit-like protein
MDLFEIATQGNQIIGHNVAFDLRMVAMNRERLEMPAYNFGEGICTMKAAKAAKIPARLGDLYRHLFGEDFDGAHDALADVKATARCYFELRRLNLI